MVNEQGDSMFRNASAAQEWLGDMLQMQGGDPQQWSEDDELRAKDVIVAFPSLELWFEQEQAIRSWGERRDDLSVNANFAQDIIEMAHTLPTQTVIRPIKKRAWFALDMGEMLSSYKMMRYGGVCAAIVIAVTLGMVTLDTPVESFSEMELAFSEMENADELSMFAQEISSWEEEDAQWFEAFIEQGEEDIYTLGAS